MTSSSPARARLLREVRAAAVLSIPFFLFVLTFLLLLLQHGGHRFAHLSANPFCRLPTAHDPQTPPTLLLHISDLHLGRPSANPHLFRTTALPRWAPLASALLVSGDLVNAAPSPRFPLGARSTQHPAEWALLADYATALNRSAPWLAVHGNHDTFGGRVPDDPDVPASAARPVTLNADVAVLALDCTLPHPLHRPLNFFGDARRAAAALPAALSTVSEGGRSAPPTVVAFSHYPSAVMAAGRALHHAAAAASGPHRPRVAAFLSGHLHTLKGLAPRGLQAVSRAGVLELQLPDLVDTGAFRVLTVDAGVVTFKDFSVKGGRPAPLDSVLVTNVPRAGLCSAGAGTVALQSTHVRLVGPPQVMEGRDIEVIIDGVSRGTAARLHSVCEAGEEAEAGTGRPAKCVPVYGVPWKASFYDDGKLHTLLLRSSDEQSEPYVFSLDGAPENGTKAKLRRLVSALFSLSDFETMAWSLCSVGFLSCFIFCIPGLLRKQMTTWAVLFIALLLRFSPSFVIANNFSDADIGFGMAGLRHVRLPSSVHLSGVDLPYIMSVTVLYGSLVPISFFDAVTSSRAACNLRHAKMTFFFAVLYFWKALSWCLEIFGAYGVFAGLISPSCAPLGIATSLSLLASLKKLRKRRD